jgi:hypothetical protein
MRASFLKDVTAEGTLKHVAKTPMICPFISFQITYDPMNAINGNSPDVDGPKKFATFGSSFCSYG